MAVKVTKIQLNHLTKKAVVDLFSDTRAEIDNITPDEIIGFPKGYEIDFGSSVFTASNELGHIQSDGTWNWGD